MFVACVRCTHGTARARTYEAASRVWLICDRGFDGCPTVWCSRSVYK